MSVGSFVLGGISGGSTVALFINEGFGISTATPTPAVAVVGGIVRRGKRRFEVVVDGVRFSARSPLQLQAKVAVWRKAHIPANDRQPAVEDETYGKWRQPKPEKEVVPDTGELPTNVPLHLHPEHTATPPASLPAPGAVPVGLPGIPPTQIAAALATQAHMEAGGREVAAALAKAMEDEESDVEALLAILLEAA